MLIHLATLLGSIKTELQRYYREATGFRRMLNRVVVRSPLIPFIERPHNGCRLTGESHAQPSALRCAHSAVGGHVSRSDPREWQGMLCWADGARSLPLLTETPQYAIPVGQIAQCRAEAYDDELGRKLWAALEEAVKEQ